MDFNFERFSEGEIVEFRRPGEQKWEKGKIISIDLEDSKYPWLVEADKHPYEDWLRDSQVRKRESLFVINEEDDLLTPASG